MTKITLSILALLLLISVNASGDATAPQVRSEIDALLGVLERSNCQFNRNGDWHTSAEAKAHLLQKLEYIEHKTTIDSTEQFIDLAATKSSFSGTPYQVKCANAPAVPSASWLNAQLLVLRAK